MGRYAARVNLLAAETSPYLLQHKDNPVHWRPWGAEAFAAARERDVPVLLSIGYSACHWCHVMAHESFEHADTAALMNELFVSIKVDREERPDVDALYMDAVVSLTGAGGWPMTVFLTPDGEPFYGGTYYPPLPRPGHALVPAGATRPSRKPGMSAAAEVTEMAGRLTDALRESARRAPSQDPVTEAIPARAVEHLTQIHDPNLGRIRPGAQVPAGRRWSGSCCAPTPAPATPMALERRSRTLDGMALGGMYDVIGGGLPPLLGRRRVAGAALREDAVRQRPARAGLPRGLGGHRRRSLSRVAESTLDYMVRELLLPTGGLASVAGRRYRRGGGRDVSCGRQSRCARRSIPPTPRRRSRSTGSPRPGTSRAPRSCARGARARGSRLASTRRCWRRGRAAAAGARRQGDRKLERARARGPGAGRLAIGAPGPDRRGRAAGGVPRTPRWSMPVARRCARARHGVAKIPAQLEDYAAVAFGLLELAVATGDDRYRRRAAELADRAVELFGDPAHGGFFSTAGDGESLVARRKELDDNPVPSGSSLLAHVLLRLARIDGDPERERLAMRRGGARARVRAARSARVRAAAAGDRPAPGGAPRDRGHRRPRRSPHRES